MTSASLESLAAWVRASRWPLALRRWGLVGLLGAALMLAAAVTAGILVPAEKAGLSDTEAAAARARTRALSAARSQRNAAVVLDPALQFRTAFPALRQRHERVAALMLLAGKLGLEARRGEFRELQEPQLGLVRYRVTLPLTGRYAALREFVEQALRDDATLSVDNLRIERSDAQSDACRIELQLSLWMQAGDGGLGAPVDAPLALSMPSMPSMMSESQR